MLLLNNFTYLGVQKVVGCALRAGVHYEAVHVISRSLSDMISNTV